MSSGRQRSLAGAEPWTFPEANPFPWLSGAYLALIGVGGILAALVGSRFPLGPSLAPPSVHHLLGTDILGRDTSIRMLAGGIRTLGMAGGASLIASALGAAWGIAAGHSAGWVDWALVHANDVLLAVPGLVLAVIVIAVLGQSEWAVILAVGVGGIGSYARLARATVAQSRQRAFVVAARALGANEIGLVRDHVVPNSMEALVTYAVLHFGWALVNSTSLTFLGLGGSPSVPDWGQMLNESRLVFLHAPWLVVAPGMALALTVLAVQQLGEWWSRR
ncbi:MAG: ABC transporter permease [Anaerolineales bacterium]